MLLENTSPMEPLLRAPGKDAWESEGSEGLLYFARAIISRGTRLAVMLDYG